MDMSNRVNNKHLSASLMQSVHKMYHNCHAFCNLLTLRGRVIPAGAKVTGATIRMWLLNKFISFLAVLIC